MNKTKTLAKLRSILSSYNSGDIVSEDDFNELMKHFPYHEDWSTTKCPPPLNVTRIEVDNSPNGYQYNCFYVVRSDGSRIDISYKSVVDGEFPTKRREETIHPDIVSACRNTIKPMIDEIRNRFFLLAKGSIVRSGLSNKEFKIETKNDFHIDHYNQDFIDVVRGFVKSNNIRIDDVETSDGVSCEVHFKSDEHKKSFIEYHNTHTHLRITTPTENLTRNRRTQTHSNTQRNKK